MDNEDISAFAVYSKKQGKNKKTNHGLQLDNKSKIKINSKDKFHKPKSNVFLNGLQRNKAGKNAKVIIHKHKVEPFVQKEIVKSLLKAQIKTVFDENKSSVTNVNDSIKENIDTLKLNDKNNVNLSDDKQVVKRIKKKKILNDETIKNSVIKEPFESKKVKTMNGKKNLEKSETNEEIKYSSLISEDSVKLGENLLLWLLSPIQLQDFFNSSWEKKPLHIKRNNKSFYKNICTLKDFKIALKENDIYFTKNLDVTSYVNGVRTTENFEGKATISMVWDFLNRGKSIRLLNPQTFIPNIRLLNTTLQEFFHCFVGANIYLTPAGTQGFAPHYDDIEAFVLQLEGEKLWRLYNPRCPQEVLPRESSLNFREDEIGEPILEVTLQPGDLLYFPRGVIHQAKCLPHAHSLHITVSCYQKNSWADLFEKILPVALQQAIYEDVEFRKGLPIGYLNHMGMLFSDQNSLFRQEIFRKFEELAQKVFRFCPLDAAADQMGVDFMQDALPPCLTNVEKLYGGDRNVKYKKKNLLKILKNQSDRNLRVKLIRATSVRLVSEDNVVYLYYTTDNSLVYHDTEVSRVRIPVEWIPAAESLIRAYPNFMDMKSLPILKKDDKPGNWKQVTEFVYFLWQRGLVMFDKPLASLRN